jgi:sporulation protein YlmC with PRC-barrel domain
MSKKHIPLIVTLTTALAAPLAAYAQASHPGATKTAVQRTDRNASDTTLAEALKGHDARISKLIGKHVVNRRGEELGKVEDLIERPGRDETPTVVISVGGFLGVGDRWHASTFKDLRVAGNDLVLDKTRDQLKSEPAFDYVPRAGEKSAQGGALGPQTKNSIGSLLGGTVVDNAGKTIGEIDDLVVSSRKDGTRAIVELSSAEGRDAKGKLVAIPFDKLHIELSGEEAKGIPQQPRVRVDSDTKPIATLPPYAYSS